MDLAEQLEQVAKNINPWYGRDYDLDEADLRELLEAAAKRIRALEAEVECLTTEA